MIKKPEQTNKPHNSDPDTGMFIYDRVESGQHSVLQKIQNERI